MGRKRKGRKPRHPARQPAPAAKARTRAAIPPPPDARRGFTRVAIPVYGALLALTLSLSLGYFWNEDYWWYLTSGEIILEQGSIPESDPLLYPEESRGEWITHSWLWTVLAALWHRGFGLPGAVAGAGLLAAVVATLVFTSGRVDRYALVNGLLAALAVVTLGGRVALKAEVASWLLLLVFFRYLDRLRSFTWRSGTLLAVLQWLWSNLHGAYPLGILVTAAYSLQAWVRRRSRPPGTSEAPGSPEPGSPDPSRPDPGVPLWFVPVLAAVSLATPGLVTERLRVLGSLLEVSEEEVAGLPEDLVLEWQWTMSGEWGIYQTAYLLLAAAGLLSFALQRPRHLGRLGTFLGMAVLGLRAVRMVPGFGLIAAAITLANLDDSPRFRRPARGLPGRLPAIAAGLFCALTLAAAAGVWLSRRDFEVGQSAGRSYTLDPLSTCPGAADYILEHDLPGPIFNEMHLGGYLGYRLHPRRQLFTDNRNLSYEILRQSVSFGQSVDAWRGALERYGFRTVVLTNLATESPLPLRGHLAADPGWRLVYVDPLAAVFVRRGNPAPAALEVGGATGAGVVPFLAPANGPGRWLRRLARPVVRYASRDLLTHYLSVLGELQLLGAVEDLASKTLEAEPGFAKVLRLRGTAHFLSGRLEPARRDLALAVRRDPGDARSRFVYATILVRLGERQQALRHLEKALELEPDNRPVRQLRRQLLEGQR